MKNLIEEWYRIRYTLYSPLYNLTIGRFFASMRRKSIKIADAKSGENILIVGAGTGLDLDYLTDGGHVTAIDVSTGMLNKLKKRAKRLNLPVEVKVMDARELQFPDESFDLIILHLIIAVVPEPDRCLNEVYRVLNKKGRVMVMDKFVPLGEKPSIFRRVINPLAVFIASNLNFEESKLIQPGFKITYKEARGMGKLFKIIRLEK